MQVGVLVVAVAVGFGGCFTPPPTPIRPPAPRQLHITLTPRVYHLRNGLTAILVPDHNADMVSSYVTERVGALDDPPDRAGLAHLAGHLSYATLTGPLTRWDLLDRLTTSINLLPGSDETAFTAQFEVTHLVEVLRVEGQRLSAHCDAGTPYWLGWQRGQVASELRANSSWSLNRDFVHALYPVGDLRSRTYDATPDSVAALTQGETCAFLDRYYVPANTTVVISGPIDPPAFERAIKAELEAIPAGKPNPRSASRPLPTTDVDTTIGADVNEPALAISYVLPEDRGERAVMTFALELLAVKAEATTIAIDDGIATLWFPEHLAKATVALDKVKAALATGLVDPKEFEATRTRRVTELLGRLDARATRLGIVADSVDLDAPFAALDRATPQGFEHFVAAHLELAHARVFRLQPNTARPKWRIATLGARGHNLRGPSSFKLDGWPGFAPTDNNVFARARTIKLANGMTAILVPTSPIPLVETALVFNVGAAAEPEAHRGSAALAVAALEAMTARTHADTVWVVGTSVSGAGWDSSGLLLRGPSLDVDLLLGQFDGLAHDQVQDVDVKKARDAMAKLASAPQQHAPDRDATFHATTFGANHPYGRMRPPTPAEVAALDVKDVEAFSQRYLQPNNATLIVTGGFDPAVVEPLVHETFDAWQGTGDTTAVQAAQVTAAAYAIDEQRPTVTLRISWQGGMMDQHYEARLLVANLLNATSPDVTAAYVQRHQGGTYELIGMFDPTAAPRQIATILTKLPDIASGDPLYTAAFQSARARVARWQSGAGESVDSWEKRILFGLDTGRDPTWLAGMAKRTTAVTYGEIAQLIHAELPLDRANIVVTGPHDVVVAVYAALGITPTWM